MTEPVKRPRGRPALPADQRKSREFKFRLSQAQRDKLDALGGAKWLHAAIDRAKVPRQS